MRKLSPVLGKKKLEGSVNSLMTEAQSPNTPHPRELSPSIKVHPGGLHPSNELDEAWPSNEQIQLHHTETRQQLLELQERKLAVLTQQLQAIRKCEEELQTIERYVVRRQVRFTEKLRKEALHQAIAAPLQEGQPVNAYLSSCYKILRSPPSNKVLTEAVSGHSKGRATKNSSFTSKFNHRSLDHNTSAQSLTSESNKSLQRETAVDYVHLQKLSPTNRFSKAELQLNPSSVERRPIDSLPGDKPQIKRKNKTKFKAINILEKGTGNPHKKHDSLLAPHIKFFDDQLKLFSRGMKERTDSVSYLLRKKLSNKMSLSPSSTHKELPAMNLHPKTSASSTSSKGHRRHPSRGALDTEVTPATVPHSSRTKRTNEISHPLGNQKLIPYTLKDDREVIPEVSAEDSKNSQFKISERQSSRIRSDLNVEFKSTSNLKPHSINSTSNRRLPPDLPSIHHRFAHSPPPEPQSKKKLKKLQSLVIENNALANNLPKKSESKPKPKPNSSEKAQQASVVPVLKIVAPPSGSPQKSPKKQIPAEREDIAYLKPGRSRGELSSQGREQGHSPRPLRKKTEKSSKSRGSFHFIELDSNSKSQGSDISHPASLKLHEEGTIVSKKPSPEIANRIALHVSSLVSREVDSPRRGYSLVDRYNSYNTNGKTFDDSQNSSKTDELSFNRPK